MYQYTKIVNDDKKNLKMMKAMQKRSHELLQIYRSQQIRLQPADILFLTMSYARLSEFEDVDSMQLVLEDLNSDVAAVYRDHELQLMYGILSELQGQHEGFDRPFAAVRDELMYRQSQ